MARVNQNQPYTASAPAVSQTKKTGQSGQPATSDDNVFRLPHVSRFNTGQKVASLTVGLLLIILAGLFSLRLAYGQRIYPGVWGSGIYLGGLTKQEALSLLDKQTSTFVETPLFIAQDSSTTKINLHDINLDYNNNATVEQAYSQARRGNIFDQFAQQIMLMAGSGDKTQSSLDYDSAKLAAGILPIYEKAAVPVKNTSLDYSDGKLKIEPGQSGQRLDLSALLLELEQHFRTLDIKQIKTEPILIKPLVNEKTIQANQAALNNYTAVPLKLTAEGKSWEVGAKEIISWLSYPNAERTTVRRVTTLESFYPPVEKQAEVDFDQVQIRRFLGDIAGQINVDAQDAQLTIEGDRATVFKQSRDGKKLDIDKSTAAILASLNASGLENRAAALHVNVTKADVNDENINNLGIKELLSEGVSYFPGSSAARLTNVRVGASKFNGVLLKPGQTFSFGGILGDVGPEQGYAKSYVILDGKQGTDYGGGLCQVSSTAFRAALLAGLPIVERHNHAFAVSYYTEPFGVPGVDATIYYPQVDFKFKNDTGAHILVQTEMKGTTLKFKFYGTKTKSGAIRGPQFISGSNDANQPSHTVFWRDVIVNGQVTKTDTFNTWYKSALDYPHVD